METGEEKQIKLSHAILTSNVKMSKYEAEIGLTHSCNQCMKGTFLYLTFLFAMHLSNNSRRKKGRVEALNLLCK